jgi:actin-like ATPase involved in cell morphogenesis
MILQPVVEGVRTVLRRVDPEFRARMLGNVLLSGGGSQILGIERSLETGLEPLPGVRVGKVHDWLFAGATGAFGLAMSMTTEQWELIHRVESVENTGSPPSRAEFLHGAPVSAGH